MKSNEDKTSFQLYSFNIRTLKEYFQRCICKEQPIFEDYKLFGLRFTNF